MVDRGLAPGLEDTAKLRLTVAPTFCPCWPSSHGWLRPSGRWPQPSMRRWPAWAEGGRDGQAKLGRVFETGREPTVHHLLSIHVVSFVVAIQFVDGRADGADVLGRGAA